jgi:ABC-type branched-subunit amino acid transport system substrate-binding protein
MVELLWADDQFTPDGTSTAIRKLVYRDKVKFIVGYWGASTPAGDAITGPQKVIFICNGWGVYPIWDATKHPYTFFGTPNYTFQLDQALAILDANPNAKKVGFLEELRPGGEVLTKKLADVFKGRGVEMPTVYFPANILDFTTYLAKLNQQGIDVLYSGGNMGQNSLMMKQMYQAGYKFKFAQMGMLPDPKAFIEMAGYDAAQGSLQDWEWPPALKKVKVKPELVTMAKRIAERWEKRFSKPMMGMSGFGYGVQNMSLLFDALKQAGTIETTKVQKVLWGGTFDTILGRYTMTGQKTYNGPIACGYPCAMSKIVGWEQVYAGEYTHIVP